MADYSYEANSNLVLQADRKALPRRENEPTGEVQSLADLINPKEFGTKALREKPEGLDEKKKKKQSQKQDGTSTKKEKKRDYRDFVMGGGTQASLDEMDGLTYRPRTKETREIYGGILHLLHLRLGDVTQEILRSAADEAICTLKDDTLKDLDKKDIIDSMLSEKLTTDQFAALVNLGKKLTDFDPEEEQRLRQLEEKAGQAMDDDQGVALIIDEEDEESSDDDEYEVRDDDASEDEEEAMLIDGPANTAEEPRYGTASDDEEEGDLDEAMPLSTRKREKKDALSISPHEIDVHYLQRLFGKYYHDAMEAQGLAGAAYDILGDAKDARDCENRLCELLNFDHFDLVKLLVHNRETIYWCVQLAKADADMKADLEEEIENRGLGEILLKLKLGPEEEAGKEEVRRRGVVAGSESAKQSATVKTEAKATKAAAFKRPRAVLDLDELAFAQGNHVMSNKKVSLPAGSTKTSFKGYDEIQIPPPVSKPMDPNEMLVPIASLPSWAADAFKTTKTLNRLQSKVFPSAFDTEDPQNLLVCAPTGAGKTNVAMLTVLRAMQDFRRADGSFDLDAFKIVYIAPMKALVQEQVGSFSQKLAPYGIRVSELTGDRQMTKEQIAETQMIITTPEKWDVITRKNTDRSYTQLVRLVIIDEIHMLHDERGPVLESVVARIHRQVLQTKMPVRIVGLSATLPNYKDVAAFCQVPKEHVHFFDSSYRPCPLQQTYIGLQEKKPIRRMAMMNEIVYNKVIEQASRHQLMVFTHSRKDTVKTAKAVRDMALEKETIGSILREDPATREILREIAEEVSDPDLKDLLPYGFGCHHAGMSRKDRTAMEDLFAAGRLQVLVSTATLAWGVNLPAHTVIIKGTQVYSPEKGKWVELSPQDVLQMLGRAGRPQYDTSGEGIIITTNGELQFYLSLLNQQLPIESQLMGKLADHLNAEIALGSIRTREDATVWLSMTYLLVRMKRAPQLYGCSIDELQSDPTLYQKRLDLAHSAAEVLDKCHLVKYDRKSGLLQGTELGRIAAHYYITHQTMATYDQHLNPSMTMIELLRVFALSDEFQFIPVREEEKMELQKLMEQVPIPVKETIEEPPAKINVLLQAYISQLKLEGFAMMADMVYVTQSAGRLLRAIFEFCLKRGWASLTRKALDLCKMVDKRMWLSMSPLRQFAKATPDMVKRLERKSVVTWDRMFEMDPSALGQLISTPKAGKLLHKLVHQFPKLELQVQIQPITRSLLRVEVSLTPDFMYDDKVHGAGEMFWVIVEDVDGERILYHDSFLLKAAYMEDEHTLEFTVPLFDPLPPNYFLSVVSDRWLRAETRLPISFRHLILPEKFPPSTALLDLSPLPISALRSKQFERLFPPTFTHFNAVQTHVFQSVYTTDDSVYLAAAAGSGKTTLALLAMLRAWHQDADCKVVYLTPHPTIVAQRLKAFRALFAEQIPRVIEALSGETTSDLKKLAAADLIVATPTEWDPLSRRWRQRKHVQAVSLVIADDLHFLGQPHIGDVYEVVVSRFRFMANQLEKPVRMVGLSTSVANATDVAAWLGAPAHATFHFAPEERPGEVDVAFQTFTIPHFASLMMAMAKPVYLAIKRHANTQPAVVFVPSRRQANLTAMDLLAYASLEEEEENPTKKRGSFLNMPEAAFTASGAMDVIVDRTLQDTLLYGIGLVHEGLKEVEVDRVLDLYVRGAVQILLVSREMAWAIDTAKAARPPHLSIVMGTQYYSGKEHRYVDYPVTEVLQMAHSAGGAALDREARSVSLILCAARHQAYYAKFLHEPLPVESGLPYTLHDHLNAEIINKTIENKQDAVDYLTWTFLYRRLLKNPNYYNLTGTTHRHLSDYLSELVETTLSDLVNAKCIVVENDMDCSPLNLGMIAAYYYISYLTIEMFSLSLRETTKTKGLLDIVSAATEFEEMIIRHHEEKMLAQIGERVPYRLGSESEPPKWTDPHVKTNILLQAHFSRVALPIDAEGDQKMILSRLLPLLYAMVDVLSAQGWLSPALAVMELCQMTVQAMWERDSPLKQLPYFTHDLVKRANAQGVQSIFDVIDLDDAAAFFTNLGLSEGQIQHMAAAVNRYPDIKVTYAVEDAEQVRAGETFRVKVNVARERDEEEEEEEEVAPVVAPYFPKKKDEGWWVVIADPSAKMLHAVRRFTLNQTYSTSLEVTAPRRVGKHLFQVLCMSDAYLGCDQEFELPLNVLEADDSDDSDEEMDEDEDDKMQE